MSPERDELMVRMQLSPQPYALVRIAQILAHRGISVRSLAMSSAPDEPTATSVYITVVHRRDQETALRFLARCIDVISIDTGPAATTD